VLVVIIVVAAAHTENGGQGGVRAAVTAAAAAAAASVCAGRYVDSRREYVRVIHRGARRCWGEGGDGSLARTARNHGARWALVRAARAGVRRAPHPRGVS
jgi:hypothetical protein